MSKENYFHFTWRNSTLLWFTEMDRKNYLHEERLCHLVSSYREAPIPSVGTILGWRSESSKIFHFSSRSKKKSTFRCFHKKQSPQNSNLDVWPSTQTLGVSQMQQGDKAVLPDPVHLPDQGYLQFKGKILSFRKCVFYKESVPLQISQHNTA